MFGPGSVCESTAEYNTVQYLHYKKNINTMTIKSFFLNTRVFFLQATTPAL